MFSILLIDDNQRVIDELVGVLRERIPANEGEIKTWVPTNAEANPMEVFNQKVDDETVLVIADYDLTANGRTGLFGSSIVGWCQSRAIPVGDYSRGTAGALPKEPNLFELRVPNNASAAAYIETAFNGFRWIRQQLEANPNLLEKRSPAAVLAALLGKPEVESQFALYGVRLGTVNSALAGLLNPPESGDISNREKLRIVGYVVGHLLLNSVLRFPGPIISEQALLAYLGCNFSEAGAVSPIFEGALYRGPFSAMTHFYWLSSVDAILGDFKDLWPPDSSPQTPGESNRLLLEVKLGRALAKPACNRCAGQNGGFICPFTARTVCQLPTCSVGSNSWIPQGARLCRIEREFYEEWAPILGI